MSLNIVKTIHLLGVAMMMMSLGGLALHSMNGGTKENNPSRKLAAAIHGTGLLLVLGAGLHMIGGYAQQSYGFNYYGTIGTNRDEFVIVRKMSKVDWLDTPTADQPTALAVAPNLEAAE